MKAPPKLSEHEKLSCKGKVKHKKRLGAVIHLRKMKNAQLEAYHCKFCNHWHIGRSWTNLKVNARLDQLIGKAHP